MSAPSLDRAKVTEIHEGVKAIADTLDRWANDKTLPISVRGACVQSQGGLAYILKAVIMEVTE